MIKILHISDTHGCHHHISALPEADIIVHSGDFTMNGTEREVINFLNWFCDLPYAHKIFVSGNHDDILHGASIEGLDSNVHYLCNSGIRIQGIKFYGVPMFMYDCITGLQTQYYAVIPDDTDVLITHTPPLGILDFDDGINYGLQELRSKIESLNIKAHLFGHIHVRHGMKTIGEVVYSNGAIMGPKYDKLNTPQIITI